MFGLSNLASRYVLPKNIVGVGVFYMACGLVWMLLLNSAFVDPWPMGIVFFIGEWAGGYVLYSDQHRYLALRRYQDFDE